MNTQENGTIELHDGDYLEEVMDGVVVYCYGEASIGYVSGGYVKLLEEANLSVLSSVSGGHVELMDNSTMTISGDMTGGNVKLLDDSMLTIKGNITGGKLWPFHGSSFTIKGKDFRYATQTPNEGKLEDMQKPKDSYDPAFWLVWGETTLQVTKRHDTHQGAVEEAKRLAGNNPGQRFYVLVATDYAITGEPKVYELRKD